MNNTNRWMLIFVLLLIFLGLVSFSNDLSNSVKISNDFSLEIVKDEHVVPWEKVYVKIDGEKEQFSNITLLLGNDKVSFKADLVDLKKEAYFELPDYNNNVVTGLKYYIKEAVIKYDDGKVVRYTTNKNDQYYLKTDERDSYFVVDEINNDLDAWRDFRGVDFRDYIYSNGNIYFKINGNVSEMVDMVLEFVRIDEKKSFKADVEGFGNRTFIDLSQTDVMVGEEYYLKDMTIYYSNGGSYSYNADNYANILNNRIFITNVVEDSSLKVEEPVTDLNQPNATNNTERENNVAGGLVVLFLVVVIAFAIFYFIKDED